MPLQHQAHMLGDNYANKVSSLRLVLTVAHEEHRIVPTNSSYQQTRAL